MTEEKSNEASGIMDIILVFAKGAVGFVIINIITLLLTVKPYIYIPVFLISVFVAFIVWPMAQAFESDFKIQNKEVK